MDGNEPQAVSDEQRAANRATLAGLRERFGPQHWLTVVGGVTATAYRLAGMTGEEFGDLVSNETGLINTGTRRKPIMRLLKGFDGHSGVIKDEGTWISSFFQFRGGCYFDLQGTISNSLPPGFELEAGTPPCRVDEVVLGAPRCLAGETVRSIDRTGWGVIIEVVGRWETLATMPADVAASVGMEAQRHPGHIPWLNYDGPAPVVPCHAQ